MTSARDRMHDENCWGRAVCCYRDGNGPGGPDCQKMDRFLDQIEEEQAHRHAQMLITHPKMKVASMGGGLCLASESIEPWYKIDAFDPELDEIHPGEDRPDCAQCVAGVEHWHRKADSRAVTEN